MNISSPLRTTGAAALFAVALALQAQTPAQPQPANPSPNFPSTQPQTDQGSLTDRLNSPTSDQQNSPTRRDDMERERQSSPANQAPRDDFNRNRTDSSSQGMQSQDRSRSQDQYQRQDRTEMSTSTQTDTQVTTIVQQIDTQGPAVVERVSTEFADVACTPENARMIFEAIHNGDEVSLTINGQSASFRVEGQLGYGDAYIALALAAEALRSAGITGCATAEQWRAVLVGGQLSGGQTSTTTESTARFPGILTLKSQGQGWGQVAQTTHVQLNQVVSRADSSLKLNSSSQGHRSGRMDQDQAQRESRSNQPQNQQWRSGQDRDRDQNKGNDRDKDRASDRSNNPNKPIGSDSH
ncbi:MAG TPA: hypothetical protein VG936_02220 [Lacunisphaera sp.]|nr:hypothetical protein [Lacunisphaera sp.]